MMLTIIVINYKTHKYCGKYFIRYLITVAYAPERSRIDRDNRLIVDEPVLRPVNNAMRDKLKTIYRTK